MVKTGGKKRTSKAEWLECALYILESEEQRV